MDYLHAVVLGIVQGLCEFLPVSSSGHLVVAGHMLGASAGTCVPVFFDVMLHVGTLVAVLAYYRRQVCRHLAEFADGCVSMLRHGGASRLYASNEGFRLALLCAVASAPIVVVVLLFEKQIEALFEQPVSAAMAFVATAGMLLLAHRHSDGQRSLMQTGIRAALLIGLAQMVAVIPGVSRSGATLSAALLLGLSPAWGVEFAMMLSIPAIAAAALYSAATVDPNWLTLDNLLPTFLGLVVSAVVGYVALGLLVRAATHHRLRWFSLYLVLLGTSLIAIHLYRAPQPPARGISTYGRDGDPSGGSGWKRQDRTLAAGLPDRVGTRRARVGRVPGAQPAQRPLAAPPPVGR